MNDKMDERIIIQKDGDAWLAYRFGFINIQESDTGYGDTIQEAVDCLLSIEEDREEEIREMKESIIGMEGDR